MNRIVFSAALLLIGIVVGLGLPEILRAQVPGYVTKQIFKTDLVNLPGQEAIIYASEWPPGFRLPLHQHEEGHEFVYVIEGEQTFEIDGVGTKVVKAGEVVYTPPNTKHFGRNATDKLSKTLGDTHPRTARRKKRRASAPRYGAHNHGRMPINLAHSVCG